MWQANVLTLFPEMFPGPLGHSIAKKAADKGIWRLETTDIRKFATNKHATVDDAPFGGGVGMVMRPDVMTDALQSCLNDSNADLPIFMMSPRGIPLTQQRLSTWVNHYQRGAIFVCPRYEGVDHRFVEYWQKRTPNFYEVSLGDFILSGGDIAAQTLIDAWVRLLPGVLEKTDATEIESFTLDLLEFSQYTRPRVWNGMEVPEALLSGHHKKIDEWRVENAQKITKERRPDLWQRYNRSEEKQ